MKGKILKVIGIAGITIFAAGYATAVILNKKNSHKEEWDEEDIAKDPDFEEVNKIFLKNITPNDETNSRTILHYSLEKEGGDDAFVVYKTKEEMLPDSDGFSIARKFMAGSFTITLLNMQYVYELLTYYPLEYVEEDEDWDGYFETSDGKFFFKAPKNYDSVLEEMSLFLKDAEDQYERMQAEMKIRTKVSEDTPEEVAEPKKPVKEKKKKSSPKKKEEAPKQEEIPSEE